MNYLQNKSPPAILFIIISTCCALLTNCASLKPSILNKQEGQYKYTPYKQRAQRLAKIKQWNINGSFLVQYPDPKSTQHKRKAEMARFTWQQQASIKLFTITIKANFNVAKITINGTNNGVQLSSNDKKPPKTYTSAEALTKQRLGFTLPVTNLYYWVRGLPVPNAPQKLVKYDKYGHLIHIQQGAWDVKFLGTQFIHTKRGDIPLKLSIENPTSHLSIIIKSKKDGW